ncbi:MAG: hypothetical protein RLZZ628_910 [Bacteroidota bacterium]|jgi:hypothetical protein
METFRIYKEIQPTYREWFALLEQLGFKKQIVELKPIAGVKRPQYRLENKAFHSVIWLPWGTEDAPVLKAYFASYSNLLYLQGVISDPQEMAKSVEKMRLANPKDAAQ